MNALQFLKTATRDFRVGALAVSSKYAIRRILLELPLDSRYVIEYGAGDGVITKEILRRLPQDGKLVAIELNPDFIHDLKKIGDPRLSVVCGDIVGLSTDLPSLGLPRIDAVVSGIPFTFLSPRQRRDIVFHTHAALAPEGVFIIYQFSLLLMPILRRHFREVRVSFEIRNFPPYFIMRAQR